jgi:hypothetical protein
MDWFDNVRKAFDEFGQGAGKACHEFGEEAEKALDAFGQGAGKACHEFGEEAEKALDAFGQEAGKTLLKFGYGFLKCLYLKRWEFLKLAIWILGTWISPKIGLFLGLIFGIENWFEFLCDPMRLFLFIKALKKIKVL